MSRAEPWQDKFRAYIVCKCTTRNAQFACRSGEPHTLAYVVAPSAAPQAARHVRWSDPPIAQHIVIAARDPVTIHYTLHPSFSSLYPGSRRQRVEFMTMAGARASLRCERVKEAPPDDARQPAIPLSGIIGFLSFVLSRWQQSLTY